MEKKHLILYLFLMLFGFNIKAQDSTQYLSRNYTKGKDSINYRILFPESFDPSQKYPIVFMLHGSGERGDDNNKQLVHGGNLFLKDENRKQFPSIVVFPQCPSNDFWSNTNFGTDSSGKRTITFIKGGKPTKIMHALMGMIKDVLKEPYINKSQVYVGGLSMGGMGTLELLRRKPKLFAAAISICGGDNIANVEKYRKVPIWIFHGLKDDVVNPEFSKTIANHLKIIGKEVKLTTYPEAGHNSWDLAFAEPQLLPWLYSHSK